jgi:hypothetical protein
MKTQKDFYAKSNKPDQTSLRILVAGGSGFIGSRDLMS